MYGLNKSAVCAIPIVADTSAATSNSIFFMFLLFSLKLSSVQFFAAFRAQSLEHIVDAMEPETLGQGHHRHGNLPQAERAVAVFAIKVSMLLVDGTVATVVAYGILQGSRAVVDGMYEAM